MTTNEIEILLARYFEGETTLQEENTLREFMLGADVPENLLVHQPLFRYFEQSGQETTNEKDFMHKFEAMIVPAVADTKTVQLHPRPNQIVFISSIAAGVLLVVGLFFTFMNDYSRKNKSVPNTPDTEIAYQQTQEALLFVSGNLNNGIRQVQKLESLDIAMSSIQKINMFYEYQPIIINPDGIKIQSKKSK